MRKRPIVLTMGFLIVVALTALSSPISSLLTAQLNHPPSITNPSPPDGATGLHPNQVLSWSCVDDDGDDLTYAVALGSCPYPWPVAVITTQTSYTPTLDLGTHYCWGIAASDGITTVVSPVWSFVTNYPPRIVYRYPGYGCDAYPVPPPWADMLVPTTQSLSWLAVDDDGDPLTYTLAFGTDEPPPIVVTTTLTSYTPTLNPGVSYYWILTVSDGLSDVGSPMWCFTAGNYLYLPLVLRNH